ncbi:fatty acyl-CoA reductase 2, chloroplastic-like [Hordeum vulgare subsp. vulgare]|uniref:Fatty acyl-CoA reductase n=1 Tax=Hordeum vulgare subsp. vulgare TaxID=112509 RepID=A0A8I6XRE3_HORVV|nr:fatty acyl-CoA reductase 2, chloroplastic-like [Hordeum vulgare subsp. vulgare]
MAAMLNLPYAVANKCVGFPARKGGDAHGRTATALQLRKPRPGSDASACYMKKHFSSYGGSWPSYAVAMDSKNPRAGSAPSNEPEGIGITEFLGGKNFLITGGTGFLAKVIIEKILRTTPDVGKIYLLIKAKDSEAAMKRLQNEIVNTELFKYLQQLRGVDYNHFLARKLVAVVGNVGEANMGIAPKMADEIAKEVDIIINSAGNTTFDERYDIAMDVNAMGPFRLMSFARRFRKLKLFLHVSTAYVNGMRQGVVLEKPFSLGDTIRKELGYAYSSDLHNTVLDMETEIKLAFCSRHDSNESASSCQEMKDLGLERARLHGWQDTYVFTKAMGEMVLHSMRGEIPVVTIRPSIIEGTCSEPIPGWIEGIRMIDPIILYYAKGQMTGFPADGDGVVDVVPADMVVNATLAAMAKHAQAPAREMHIYHVGSSTANPLTIRDMFSIFFQYFTRYPLSLAAGQPIKVAPMRLVSNLQQFKSNLERDVTLWGASETLSPRARMLFTMYAQKIMHLARIYQPYGFYGCRFDNANTEALFAEMSVEEKAQFHFDVRSITWKEYFTNVHIPGFLKHVMKGRGRFLHP